MILILLLLSIRLARACPSRAPTANASFSFSAIRPEFEPENDYENEKRTNPVIRRAPVYPAHLCSSASICG